MKSVLQYCSIYLLCVLNVKNVLCKVGFNTNAPPKISRATEFVPKVIEKTCYLKPDRGPCRSNIRMVYFNSDTKKCESFFWGGCQGNGNRYDTVEECKSTCMSSEGYRRPQPRWCQLAFDYGFCFGAAERWYYDRLWKVCKKTIYSGCGGNKNNFYSKEQCDSVCRFGKRPLGLTTKSDGLKKVIIINPWDATTRQRRSQDSTGSITGEDVTTARYPDNKASPASVNTPKPLQNNTNTY